MYEKVSTDLNILTLTKEWNINGEKVVFGVEKM